MALDTRRCFWFGTEERAGFFATPLKGADSSPSAWGVDGTLLNGGGYAFNSFGSHKRYSYEWPQSSSPETAQMMKSYRDGTYGRGLLYFLEPGIYRTNILPAHWADPSMSLDNEAPSLVYGVDPVAVPTSGGAHLNLPINSAQYDLSSVPVQTVPTPDSSVFLPVPTGHTLFLGAFYSSSGAGGIFATPINNNGTLGVTVKLTEKDNADTDVVVDRFEGDIKGVRLWVGRSSAVPSSVTIAAMSGRLLETIDAVTYGPWVEQARNLTSNTSFESSSGTVTVKTNYALSPFGTGTLPGYFAYPASSPAAESNTGGVVMTGVSALPVPGHPNMASYVSLPAAGTLGGGISFATGVPAGDYVVSMWVNRRNGPTTQMQLAVRGVAGIGTARTFPFDVWTYVEEPVTITAGQAPAVIGWRSVNVIDPTQTNFFVANMQVSPAGQNVPQGDLAVSGAGTGYDSDMTPAFLGTAEASASVLRGVEVAGVSATGCFAIRSSQWAKEGQYSLRLIPNSLTNNVSFAVLALPSAESQSRGTAIITRRIAAPVAGLWAAGFGRIYWNPAPQIFSNVAPNVAGETELRVYAAPTPGVPSTIILPHGGLTGSGDIWYDLATVVPGVDYPGPAFSGSTPATSDQEQYRWLGGANASASVYETRTRTGDPATQAKLVVGPWIGGQGHSGCRFVGTPSYVNNGPVEGGRVGFAASFAEVGSWVYG